MWSDQEFLGEEEQSRSRDAWSVSAVKSYDVSSGD